MLSSLPALLGRPPEDSMTWTLTQRQPCDPCVHFSLLPGRPDFDPGHTLCGSSLCLPPTHGWLWASGLAPGSYPADSGCIC